MQRWCHTFDNLKSNEAGEDEYINDSIKGNITYYPLRDFFLQCEVQIRMYYSAAVCDQTSFDDIVVEL